MKRIQLVYVSFYFHKLARGRQKIFISYEICGIKLELILYNTILNNSYTFSGNTWRQKFLVLKPTRTNSIKLKQSVNQLIPSENCKPERSDEKFECWTKKKNVNVAVRYMIRKGCNFFPEKNWYSIIYGKNAETTKLGTRDKRDFVLQSGNMLVPLRFCFCFFFLTGEETVNVFSVFPFLFHKMEHILTSLNIN